jgi:hypothetical protein
MMRFSTPSVFSRFYIKNGGNQVKTDSSEQGLNQTFLT